MNLFSTGQTRPVGAHVRALWRNPQVKFLMRVSLFYISLLMLSMQLLLANPGKGQGLEDISITLEVKNENLKEVFRKIEKQTGLLFAYQPQQVSAYTGISIDKSTRSVKDFLDLVLLNTTLTYQKVNGSVIIFKKAETESLPAPTEAEAAPVQDVIINGKIIDKETQTALPGVSVMIKGTARGTVTDSDGNYSLEVNEGDILVFSFIGFVTYETSVTGRATIDVQLESSIKSLDEVVVMGYGTTTRRLATGSISKVSAADIANQPVTNILQALQGRMPGVSITQANGLPGSGITVQVRGENSLTRINQPLYIVDGVPYLSTPINVQSQASATGGSVLPSAEGNTSPLNSINPADIESIEVLKDADATAIYGSRAANGVVLITTKKGKPGKTNFSVSASTGASKVPHFVETLSTQEYLRLRALGMANAGTTPTAANAQDLVLWDQNAYTDYQKLLTGNTAKTTDVTASLSGGDRRTVFFLSGTFHKENNVFTNDQGYRRAALSFNASHTTENDKLQVGVSAMYNADNNNISVVDMTSVGYYMPPNFPLYNDDGSLYWTGATLGTANPLGNFRKHNENKTSNLISSLNLRYTILPGLDVKTTAGFSRTDMDQMQLTPLSAQDPGIATNQTRAFFTYNVTNNYIVEPQITYAKNIGIGRLDALVGGTWQFQDSKQPYYVSASGYLSDEFITNIGSATNRSVSSTSSQYKYASLFGRLTYNIENKYIANVSFRRDGSSRFGPSNKFGNFGSVGAAWIFSEEDFLKNGPLTWLTFGKLRGSYGVVGSDNISNYQYLETFSTSTYVYNGSTGLVPTRIANSQFKWEETKKIEGALELGFWNDRLLLTSAYYRNRTSNQLLTYPISSQTGFTSYQSNLDAVVQNAGWEFTLTSKNIQKGDLTWTTSVNFSRNRNELVAYPGLEKSPYANTYQVGTPINSFRLYKYAGLDATTGRPTVEDRNGNGSITAADRYYYGPRAPKFFGGVNNTVSWKGFTLDFTFQFVKQQGLSLLATSYVPSYFLYNMSADVVSDYLALGSENNLVSSGVPAYLAYSNYAASDKSLVDASFIRLKNVSLSYSLPKNWTNHARMKSARVYVQGQNLFTITGYDGFDPESQGLATPPLRTIIAGLQFVF